MIFITPDRYSAHLKIKCVMGFSGMCSTQVGVAIAQPSIPHTQGRNYWSRRATVVHQQVIFTHRESLVQPRPRCLSSVVLQPASVGGVVERDEGQTEGLIAAIGVTNLASHRTALLRKGIREVTADHTENSRGCVCASVRL